MDVADGGIRREGARWWQHFQTRLLRRSPKLYCTLGAGVCVWIGVRFLMERLWLPTNRTVPLGANASLQVLDHVNDNLCSVFISDTEMFACRANTPVALREDQSE